MRKKLKHIIITLYNTLVRMFIKVENIIKKWYTAALVSGDFSKELRINCMDLDEMPHIPDECEDLNIGINMISRIDSLPSNLKHLNIIFNQVESLPPLPEGLLTLDIYANKFTDIPPLPSNLIKLNVGANKIMSLPEDLPKSLKELHAYRCSLTELPENLPRSLNYMDVSHNSIRRIANLRELDNLDICDISNNLITVIPELPRRLRFLYCDKNPNEFSDKCNSFIYNDF